MIVVVIVCVIRAHRQKVARPAAAASGRAGATTSRRLWENAAMACILLDVDGVLHVSGEPIPGAVEAVARLRRQGHSLRFVTNNSTRPRATLAEELRDARLRARRRRAADDRAGSSARARRQARVRARDGRDRPRSGGHRARRRPRRRGAARRLRRDDRAEPGVLVDEPRPRIRRAADGRRAVLPAQEQVVADEPRPAARRGRVRRRARVRDRRRRDRARQAERCRTSPRRSTRSAPSPS